MGRQLILQYRDELLSLQAEQLVPPSRSSTSRLSQRLSGNMLLDHNEDIASDLLAILQSIPIQIIGLLMPLVIVRTDTPSSGQLVIVGIQGPLRRFDTAGRIIRPGRRDVRSFWICSYRCGEDSQSADISLWVFLYSHLDEVDVADTDSTRGLFADLERD